MSALAAGLEHDLRYQRLLLGYAGLLPFAACLGVMVWSEERNWQLHALEGMRNYAALIASFLGAVHWGVATDRRQRLQTMRLAWGVTPAVLAWFLLTLPGSIALFGFAALFTLILLVDLYLLPILDNSYRRLRLQLSGVVVATLLVAAVVAPVAPS